MSSLLNSEQRRKIRRQERNDQHASAVRDYRAQAADRRAMGNHAAADRLDQAADAREAKIC